MTRTTTIDPKTTAGMGRGARIATLALLALASCNPPPASAYYDHSSPQSLLDVSSEVVNLSVVGKPELSALSNWIANDPPSRAELFCDANAPNCKQAQRILQNKGVETSISPAPNNTVTLVYERILARDCNPRFIENGVSLYYESSPSFGCSIAGNTVQEVSDKREFINPNLSDDPSAVAGVNAYRSAFAPKPASTEKYGVGKSTVSSAGSGGGS